MRILLGTALLLLLPAGDAAARNESLPYGFLWESFAADTRAASMGRVDLAADGGPFGAWAIPSTLHSGHIFQAGYRQHDYPVDAEIRGAAVALTIGSGRLRLAWNGAAYALDGIPVVMPDGTVTDGMSYDIHERVDRFGACYSFLSRRPGGGTSIAAVVGGAAGLYDADVGGFNGSATDFDLGAMVRYTREGERGWFGARAAFLIRNLLGHSYDLDARTVQLPHRADLSLAFEGGRILSRFDRDLKWLVIFTHRRHIRSHYDLPNDTNHVGAELAFAEIVFVRCGVTNIPIGGEKRSWGLGLSTWGLVESPWVVTVDFGQYDAGMLGGWSSLLTVGGTYSWGAQ